MPQVFLLRSSISVSTEFYFQIFEKKKPAFIADVVLVAVVAIAATVNGFSNFLT